MKKILFLLIIPITIISCSKKEEIVEQVKPRTTNVRVVQVTLTNIDDIYTIPGIAEAWEDIIVPAEVSGQVSTIYKDEGNFVNKDEPILKINTVNLQANLNSAKVQLDNDYKDYTRQVNLYKQKAISQKQLDASKRAYELSKVAYQLALDEFNKGIVKSPVSGIIDDIIPSVGEFISVGTDIARLIDQSRLKIYVNIPERDVKYLKEKQEINVYLADISSDKNIKKGTVGFISVVADPKTLTHKARIDIAPDEDIRPGRITRVDIVRKSYQNVIVVDLYSIVDKNGNKVVFINNNGIAEERPIVIESMIGDKAIIKSGIKEGEELVVSGQQFLENNSHINIVGQ